VASVTPQGINVNKVKVIVDFLNGKH
jgi:hypothetical protein